MGDKGLETFLDGFTAPLSLDPSSDEDILSLLKNYLPVDFNPKSSSPVVAIIDLSYNHLTNYHLLRPLIFSPEIGLSELFLDGNKSTPPFPLPPSLPFLSHILSHLASGSRLRTW
jgi:hypothetical protein